MSKFDLEADSDDVFPFLLRHIYDKTAETSPDEICLSLFGYGYIVCTHSNVDVTAEHQNMATKINDFRIHNK